MNKPTHIIVHCSDSMWGDAKVVDAWHRERGFSGIGYHFLVLNGCRSYAQRKNGDPSPTDDGRIETGRAEYEVGAHCIGFNDCSVGVCLIGAGGDFTTHQLEAARDLVNRLRAKYGISVADVLGHCETASGMAERKTCPTLDMKAFRESLTGPGPEKG